MKPVAISEGVAAEQPVDQRKRNANKGAFYSKFIDMFGIYLPAVVMPPVLPYFHPPHLSGKMEPMPASLVFITTLLGRPVGQSFSGESQPGWADARRRSCPCPCPDSKS
ncbi:hypothetical protein WCQ02_38280 [Paraburkholderia tropica]|uniref:hypothetical protein n=1 Tax=Paraburkholderia tropica TaxID=92647 RepID=UPI0030160E65